MSLDRRHFLFSGTAALAVGAGACAQESQFEITRSEEEWRAMLTELQFAVMREEATEPPYSSPLHDQTAPGTYLCRGCDLPLYASDHKYDSGTGWPSFWQALDNAIGTKRDRKLFISRTECHCRRCGSHLGHIFDDGPQPTGKRHCLNGVSLKFRAA